jgi:AmiR/NasT family two-component response regulator
MTTLRLIQNFRQCRVVLWAGGEFQAEPLERALLRLGVSLCQLDHLGRTALDPDRDVVFIDADQAVDTSLLIPPGATLPEAPVIGLVGVEAPSRLKLLAEAGATATLRKPVQGPMVYSALFLGVNTYRRLRSAETRLAAGDRKRRGRRLLIKAVVALVQARGLTDDDAYAELRRESMRRRLDLEEFCEALFEPGSPFPPAWPAGPAASHGPIERKDIENAQDADAGCRDGGIDAAHGGASRRSDQARRA